MRAFAGAVLGIWLGAAAGVADAQNLVTNGGFETGNFSGWTVSPGATGSWIVVFTNPNAGHTGNSFAQFLSFGDFDQISQNLVTTPSASYKLDFWLRSFQDHFMVFWNGSSILDIDAANASTSWTEYTLTVTGAGSSTPLAFRGRGSFFLDDVSVVPAPGGALLLGAATVMGLTRRRRDQTL